MVKSDNIPLSGFGDWLSNAWDNVSGWITDAANWVGDTFFGGSHEVNLTNQSIANQNIAFQQQENEIIRQREDTAYQRAAADLQAAGLSKTLAAGHPAASTATTAPNNTFQMQRNLAGANAIKNITDFYFEKRADSRAKDLNDAQIAKLEADTKSQEISNKYMEDVYKLQILGQTAQNEVTAATLESIQIQNEIAQIEKSYRGLDLQASIDQKLAQKEKYLAEAGYTQKSIDLLVEQITSEILKQDQVKAVTALDKQQLENLIREYSYKYYQIEALKHDINYAQFNGLPVGNMPSGLVGGIIPAAQSISNSLYNGVITPTFNFLKNGYNAVKNWFTGK